MAMYSIVEDDGFPGAGDGVADVEGDTEGETEGETVAFTETSFCAVELQ